MMTAAFEHFSELLARRRAALPAYVETVLEAATVTTRESADGDVRVAVLLGGGSFFLEQAETRLRRRWPELSEKQIERARDYLEARARLARTAPRLGKRRKSWIFDY